MTASARTPLSKVTLNAARSKEFPDGSIRHGYEFLAPLTPEGRIDVEAWKARRGECFVHRFWGDEPPLRGLLGSSPGRARRLDLGVRIRPWSRPRRRRGRLPLRRPRLQGRRIRVGSGRGRAEAVPGRQRRPEAPIGRGRLSAAARSRRSGPRRSPRRIGGPRGSPRRPATGRAACRRRRRPCGRLAA